MGGSALLLLDVQNGLVNLNESLRAQTSVIERIGEAVVAARASGWLIVAVSIGFREGYPDIAPANALFGPVAQSGRFTEGSDDLTLSELAAPGGADLIVRKRRLDAFFGTDLDIVLRSAGITQLALTGFTTSGGVLATVHGACDRDYEVTVLEDACADSEPTLHQVIVEKIFPSQAAVLTVESWRAGPVAPSP
jgi:nicotinamidase-related amidase